MRTERRFYTYIIYIIFVCMFAAVLDFISISVVHTHSIPVSLSPILGEPKVFVIVFVESACLRAKRITCAFPACSVSFVPHGNEKHVVTNTLILVYMSPRADRSVFSHTFSFVFSLQQLTGEMVLCITFVLTYTNQLPVRLYIYTWKFAVSRNCCRLCERICVCENIFYRT